MIKPARRAWVFVLAGLLTACRPQAAANTGDEHLPVLVLLHGYGGTPSDVERLAEGLGVRVRIVAPHGSLSTPTGGWGWFPRDSPQGLDGIAPAVRHAAEAVITTIETETRGSCGRPIVAGFSQGGFLAYAVAALAPERIAAALPIGGVLPPALYPTQRAAPLPLVEPFHGEADRVIDPAADRATYAAFEGAGYTGTFHGYGGVGHAVPPQVAAEVRATIERVVRAEGCAH